MEKPKGGRKLRLIPTNEHVHETGRPKRPRKTKYITCEQCNTDWLPDQQPSFECVCGGMRFKENYKYPPAEY